ncbi:MAG: hypothetical protein HYV97_19465 [Bdellovibrio sp.]|nr:hypothetical protein [Bdellovibrio sp.]
MFYFYLIVFLWSGTTFSDDTKFSTHLQAKFHVKACTNCHDFFVKKRPEPILTIHKDVTPDMCVTCHDKEVTGFKDEDEWFARPGIYTSGMNSKKTCETMKKDINAKFKNDSLVARQLEKHLFEDPRVLWSIEGATSNSGKLPDGKKQVNLVKGGLEEWKKQVNAWIKGGMKCN